MHTSALEDAELTENELQPEITDTPTIEQPETPEPETTALMPTEPEVIEGEVIEIEPPEPFDAHTPPKQKPYWLLIPFTILFCLLFLAASSLFPLLTPSATVTIIPVERNITLTAAIQVQGRELPLLTLMQSTSIPATGKRHQSARHAGGTITFYNGSFSSQTIAAGTMVTGKDGVHINTGQTAIIPAGNPPIYGHITVSAHAVLAGSQGNIAAYDINQACCGNSVLAKNTQAFTGGASARDFLVVTRTDMNNAVTSLLVPLSQSEDAALQAQLHTGEALITPSCTPSVSSNHKPGDEAKHVSVTVSVTCEGFAYVAQKVYAHATQMIAKKALQRLGTGYTVLGDITASVIHATITDQARGIATLTVKLDATFIYQITPGEKHQLIKLIAGKSKSSALHKLLSQPGIQAASIRCTGGDTLPHDPNHITISMVYSVVSPSLF